MRFRVFEVKIVRKELLIVSDGETGEAANPWDKADELLDFDPNHVQPEEVSDVEDVTDRVLAATLFRDWGLLEVVPYRGQGKDHETRSIKKLLAGGGLIDDGSEPPAGDA